MSQLTDGTLEAHIQKLFSAANRMTGCCPIQSSGDVSLIETAASDAEYHIECIKRILVQAKES